MPSVFGRALRRLRDKRGFSLRVLGQLADVDHAYIQRLETGEKEAPSDDVLQRLLRALKAGPRESEILQIVIGKDVSPELIDLVLDDPSIKVETFKLASQINARGKPDWRRIINVLDRARKDF